MSDAIGFSDGGYGARSLALVTRTLSAEGIGFSCMVKASSMNEKEQSITQGGGKERGGGGGGGDGDGNVCIKRKDARASVRGGRSGYPSRTCRRSSVSLRHRQHRSVYPSRVRACACKQAGKQANRRISVMEERHSLSLTHKTKVG